MPIPPNWVGEFYGRDSVPPYEGCGDFVIAEGLFVGRDANPAYLSWPGSGGGAASRPTLGRLVLWAGQRPALQQAVMLCDCRGVVRKAGCQSCPFGLCGFWGRDSVPPYKCQAWLGLQPNLHAYPVASFATVTPSPPSCGRPGSQARTWGWRSSASRTAARRRPVPLPCTIRTKGSPAK